MRLAAHDRPPPNATITHNPPDWRRPPRHASSRAIKVDAEAVFPYLSRFTTNFFGRDIQFFRKAPENIDIGLMSDKTSDVGGRDIVSCWSNSRLTTEVPLPLTAKSKTSLTLHFEILLIRTLHAVIRPHAATARHLNDIGSCAIAVQDSFRTPRDPARRSTDMPRRHRQNKDR